MRESLEKLYEHELKDLYSAEKQLLEALPKLSEKASHDALRKGFDAHRRQTQEHVERLDTIFDSMSKSPGNEKCKGMEGLIREGEKAMEEFSDSDVLDAALIAAAQRVEHYEMAGYGCARTYANQLGLTDHAELLQRTLDEEGQTDEKLTKLAEEVVNIDALKVG